MPHKSRVIQSPSPSTSESEIQDQGAVGSASESYQSPSDESADEKESATKRWRASEPPEEVFGDSEREWEYEIIGEEVDHDGNLTYEVLWNDWARADGTRTTWVKATDGMVNSDAWDRRQQKLRNDMVKESLEIELMTTVDIYNTETYLRSQAYEEKLHRALSTPQPNHMLDLQERERKLAQADLEASMEIEGSSVSSYPLRSSRRASTRQKTEISIANAARSSSKAIPDSVSMTVSQFSSNPTTPNFSTPLQKPIRIDDRIKQKTKQTVVHVKQEEKAAGDPVLTPSALRSQLHKSWTRTAAQEKAAPIYFTNTVDAEPVPPLSIDFLYLESKYKFGRGVTHPSAIEGFLVKCTNKTCDVAGLCECQYTSDVVNQVGEPIFAYTPEGHFAFNVAKGTEVVECNKFCECSVKTCYNRVSQRPRDVPIEIFKTPSRGWGVRSLIDVKRGKVLARYTGLVVSREIARSHPHHVDSEYVFDLDGDENDDGVPPQHDLYSVDSKSAGNWTRFINHSCSPNLGIYLVVDDVPPDNGLPFIVFVATKDLPARTEFTVDYNPRASERFLMAQAGVNLRAESPLDTNEKRPCECGSDNCRGSLN